MKIPLLVEIVFVVVCVSTPARGDGDTLRLSRSAGGYRISVFSAPTPFQMGPVDISVLVQDAATGNVLSEAQVMVRLTRCDHPDVSLNQLATSQAATNKLLKAAVFDLPAAGCWTVEATIKGEQGTARVHFDLEAADRLLSWTSLWMWIGWPVPVILLFAVHQVLVGRKRGQRP